MGSEEHQKRIDYNEIYFEAIAGASSAFIHQG